MDVENAIFTEELKIINDREVILHRSHCPNKGCDWRSNQARHKRFASHALKMHKCPVVEQEAMHYGAQR